MSGIYNAAEDYSTILSLLLPLRRKVQVDLINELLVHFRAVDHRGNPVGHNGKNPFNFFVGFFIDAGKDFCLHDLPCAVNDDID